MNMRARRVLVLILMASILASCGAVQKLRPKKGLTFDGQKFRARAQQVGDAREEFEVTVRQAGRSPKGAQQAALYEATRYCIENFGRSEIDWRPGQEPAEDAAAARVAGDRITLRGRCKGWS